MGPGISFSFYSDSDEKLLKGLTKEFHDLT